MERENKFVCMIAASLSMDLMEDDFELDLSEDVEEDTDKEEYTEEVDNKDEEGEESSSEEEEDEDTDPNNIFSGRSKEDKDTGKASSEEEGSTLSSNYSSILSALYEDGVLPDIDVDKIKDMNTPEKFAEAIEMQVEAKLEAAQKRIHDALNNGITVNEVQEYEGTIQYLESIKDEDIESESEESETLRKDLILQDFLNKGFKEDRANREVKKSIDSGNDIEDAKLALESNKEFFSERYNNLLKNKEEETKRIRKENEEKLTSFKKRVIDTEEPIKGINVDKNTRQQILNNIIKPVHKDKDGTVLSELQKFQVDNPVEAQYYMSIFYTLTDGFKNIDKLVSKKAKDATKSAIRRLEKTINTPVSGIDTGANDFDINNSTYIELDI